jgi:hypothetical protein
MSKAGNCPIIVDGREVDPRCICREEHCDRVGVHLAHGVVPPPKKERPPTPGRALWKRPSSKALDNAIAKATSKYWATHFGAILREVRNDYGTAESEHSLERAVYRHLKKLVARGHIVKLDLGLSFAAYLRPGSKLLNDIDYLREQMVDQLEVHGQYAA